jgi:hypothetical protein
MTSWPGARRFRLVEASEVCRQLAERIGGTRSCFRPPPQGPYTTPPAQAPVQRHEAAGRGPGPIRSGRPQVLRQYAQALIDDGSLAAAKLPRRSRRETRAAAIERFEALGLLGRLHKQLYIDARRPGTRSNRRTSGPACASIWRATAPIRRTTSGTPSTSSPWSRARRDGVELGGPLEIDEAARPDRARSAEAGG